MEKNEHIIELFARYLAGTSTPDEINLLLQYFNAPENEILLKSLILAEMENSAPTNSTGADLNTDLDDLFRSIQKKMREQG